MKRGGVVLLLLLIIMCGLGSAAVQTLGGTDGYPRNQPIPLIQTCTSCTYVNITYIKLGNGSLLNINSAMTADSSGTFFNYTLAAIFTNATGEYILNCVHNDGGTAGTCNYNFFVHNNGSVLTTAESNLYIVLIILIFLIFLFFGYNGLMLKYTDQRSPTGTITKLIPSKYLKLLSVWIAAGALLWDLAILTSVLNNFVSLPSVYNLSNNLYIFMQIVSWVLSIAILAILLVEIWKDIFITLLKRVLYSWGNRK